LGELVNDIVLLGFSRCAQEGEKRVNDETIPRSEARENTLSHIRC
jgi:hypothetical protein